MSFIYHNHVSNIYFYSTVNHLSAYWQQESFLLVRHWGSIAHFISLGHVPETRSTKDWFCPHLRITKGKLIFSNIEA